MKHILSICILPMMACLSAVEVPNTFVDGEPAYASEVNENFETLKDAVNANVATGEDLESRVTAVEDAGTGSTYVESPFTHKIKSNVLSVVYTKNDQPYGTEIIMGSDTYKIYMYKLNNTVDGKVYHIKIPCYQLSGGSYGPYVTFVEANNSATTTFKIDGYSASVTGGHSTMETFALNDNGTSYRKLTKRKFHGSTGSITLKINGIIMSFQLTMNAVKSDVIDITSADLTNAIFTIPSAPDLQARMDILIDYITITEQP